MFVHEIDMWNGISLCIHITMWCRIPLFIYILESRWLCAIRGMVHRHLIYYFFLNGMNKYEPILFIWFIVFIHITQSNRVPQDNIDIQVSLAEFNVPKLRTALHASLLFNEKKEFEKIFFLWFCTKVSFHFKMNIFAETPRIRMWWLCHQCAYSM